MLAPHHPTLVLWRSKTPQPGNRGAAAGAIHSAPATLALFAAAEDTPHSHGCPGSPRLSRKHNRLGGTCTAPAPALGQAWECERRGPQSSCLTVPRTLHGRPHPGSRGAPSCLCAPRALLQRGRRLVARCSCSQRLSRTFHNPEGRSTPSTIWPSRTATALNITGTIPFAKRGGNDSIAP